MKRVIALMVIFLLAVSWTGSPPFLQAQAVGDTATLTWIPPTEGIDNLPLIELSDYILYEAATTGGPYVEIARPPAGTASYALPPLAEGKHYYVITAWNSGGESDYSNEVLVAVQGVIACTKVPGSLASVVN